MPEFEIQILDNGPYIVTGPVSLKDAAGGAYAVKKDTIALCRCGRSASKPFCDGAHARSGFQATDRAPRP